jgi:hypothetical protein
MKKLLNINPSTVISVTEVNIGFRNENIKDDDYRYICNLTNDKSVLLPYNPLSKIKQFINYQYAITSNSNKLNIKIEKVIVYIDYYGFETSEIVEKSDNEIRSTYDTYLQALEALTQLELEEEE